MVEPINIQKLICPACNKQLIFFIPGHHILHCRCCNRFYEIENGRVGKEIESDFIKKYNFLS